MFTFRMRNLPYGLVSNRGALLRFFLYLSVKAGILSKGSNVAVREGANLPIRTLSPRTV